MFYIKSKLLDLTQPSTYFDSFVLNALKSVITLMSNPHEYSGKYSRANITAIVSVHKSGSEFNQFSLLIKLPLLICRSITQCQILFTSSSLAYTENFHGFLKEFSCWFFSLPENIFPAQCHHCVFSGKIKKWFRTFTSTINTDVIIIFYVS